MSRFELYVKIHKAIRATLFETVAEIARTDFSQGCEADAAAERVRRLVGFLDEHAAHEDAVVMPELLRVAPEVHADLEAEHHRTDGLQREVEALADRIERAEGEERIALGRRLHTDLARLAAEHLRHLDNEETHGQRVLWAHRTDEELAAMQRRITGAIPPARLADWLEILLPAVNGAERAVMVAEMRAAMPPEVFARVTAPARSRLGEAALQC